MEEKEIKDQKEKSGSELAISQEEIDYLIKNTYPFGHGATVMTILRDIESGKIKL